MPDLPDVLVIGAGAAGLMCAIEAGRRGRRVLVLDHAKKVGEKIRISGGGRCNFTNIHASPADYISSNPNFCKSALARYGPQDFIQMVEAHGIAYFEKTLGQLFCEESSQLIIDMLLDECRKASVRVQARTDVQSVEKQGSCFVVTTSNGPERCQSLVVACGGKSIPKMGATGFGYQIAEQFGLEVVSTRPGLVPLTFDDRARERMSGLAGISQDIEVKCGKKRFREALLFTHRGISGPAILQISSYWQEGETITIDLLPDVDLLADLKDARECGSKQGVSAFLSREMPKRLAEHISADWLREVPEGPIAQMSNKSFEIIVDAVKHWALVPQGSEGYRTAEVTLGGVSTDDLSSKSFESKKVPGLYFVGEVVDVTGHLGGFNFQWAWASGHAAGQFV